VGGKGLFVKELETALEEGRAQLAVHSLKDVPMDLPPGFVLTAIMEREDPRDAFVSNKYASLAELPQGAVVGTSSLRRVVQLKARRPDLRIEPLRGNLGTRLRKLDEGGYDAIVLAAAGLKRLGLEQRIRACFAVDEMIPCAGQGALGLEVRGDAIELQAALQALRHQPTWLATLAERAVSRALGGSCSVPLAAHARWSGEQLQLEVALGHATQDGAPLLRAELAARVQDDAQAEALGMRAAAALRELGAAAYLATH
jgi:hydroxymethylbilane synthase